MPRTRTRKTQRGMKDLSIYEQAYNEIVNNFLPIRSAAKKYNLCHVSLMRYKNKKKFANKENGTPVTMGYRSCNTIFSVELEQSMVDYIIKSAEISYEWPPKEIRKLAYQLAVKYDIKRPKQWDENGLAGADWFSSFMKRNPQLSTRSPELTSLSRPTSFNETNVKLLFDNLQAVLDREKFESKVIYNVDGINGIMPIDFSPSYVTDDRPLPVNSTDVEPSGLNSNNSTEPHSSTSTSADIPIITGENITQDARPLPARKITRRRKMKRTSTIYTDSPESGLIRIECSVKQKKRVSKATISSAKKQKKTCNKSAKKKTNLVEVSGTSDDDDDDTFCLVCLESYNSCKNGEKWVQCIQCKDWSHQNCTKQNPFYICHNCKFE